MNTFGTNFRLSIFGESHGEAVGVVVDGCPAGIALTASDFIEDLNRRKSGSQGTTLRRETDYPHILTGVFMGHTTGSPITIIFENKHTISKNYERFKYHPRPGHVDFAANKKFKGFQDYRGSGHFSGRLTLGLVAAGTIAKRIIAPIDIKSALIEAGGNSDIDAAVQKAIETKNSIGGVVECIAKRIPIGLGEPFFNSLESIISHLAFSIPGIKAIEFGDGFRAAKMKGCDFNDLIINEEGKTATNHSGGISGGISNGNDLVFRVSVRPAASIEQIQETYNFKTKQIELLSVKGHHDICIALRVPVIVEAITAIALADLQGFF